MLKRKTQNRIIVGKVDTLKKSKILLYILMFFIIVLVFTYSSLLFLTVKKTNDVEFVEKEIDRILVQNTELKSKYLAVKTNIVNDKKNDFEAVKNIVYLKSSSDFAINYRK